MDKLHIHMDPGTKCWFTSDQHFGHNNVINFCHRPWKFLSDMEKALVDRWNEVVGKNDIVFMLGDFTLTKDKTIIPKIIKSLNAASIYVVLGNHDTAEDFKKCDKRVKILSDITTVWISGWDEQKPQKEVELVLSHFPLATWSHFWRGVVNLHGHIHSGPGKFGEVDNPGIDLHLKPNLTYDVGVDNNRYYPVEIRDILTKLKKI